MRNTAFFIIATLFPLLTFCQGISPKELKAINASFEALHKNAFKIHLGGNTFGASPDSLKKGHTVNIFSMGDENTITIALVNNQLKVSMTIYASDGKAIAVIKNSQWVVNPNKLFMKNYDSNGFEVIDEKNFVAVSVDRRSPKDIYINGVFRRKGSILVATNAGSRPFPKSMESTEEYEKEVRSIKKIFKYTGKDFIGKREIY